MAKETKSVKKNKGCNCKEFEMDLTDYVMGETTFLTKEKQEALFEHLRKCDQCRAELWNWKEVLAMMKTKSAMAKPEHQKKINELIKRLHEETDKSADSPANSGKMPVASETQLAKNNITTKWEIGSAAGKIYNCLKANGPAMPIPLIREKTGLWDFPFYEAVGWLAKEEKVTLTKDKDGKPAYASLNPGA
jgi:hypothetical protein